MSSTSARQLGVFSRSLNPRFRFVASAFVFRIVLDTCYFFYLESAFADHFLTPMEIDFNVYRYALSYIYLLAALLFVPFGKKNFSGIFFMAAMMFLYIPMTTMFGLNSEKSSMTMAIALFSLFSAYIWSTVSFINIHVPMTKNGESKVIGLSVFFILIFLVWSYISGAFSNINFDVTQIYINRETSGKQLDIGPMAYINLWTQKVFNPFLLAIALHRRSKFLIVGAILVQIYFFAVTQHRAHLFVPVLIVMIHVLYKRDLSLPRLYFIAGLGLAAFLISTLLFNLNEIAAVIIRRAFFVPASVTFDWIEYFNTHQKVYWSDNFLSSLINSIYSGQLLPRVLGEYFAPGKDLAFNAGIVGAGYGQAGIFGVFLYASILGLLLKFVNTLIRNGLPTYLVASILLAPVRTVWADSDLFSSLLSHGILVGILVLWLSGKPKEFYSRISSRMTTSTEPTTSRKPIDPSKGI